MSNDEDKVTLKEAISIGVGGMVGGGIFAVLGLAVTLAQGGTPVAFAIAGFIALLTAYSYSKLSIQYADRGGTVKFINTGFGVGVFSGGINNLLWFSYIIMLSLYSSAFGSYASHLLPITGSTSIDTHFFISLVVIVSTAINYFSVKVVGQIESYAVGVKVIILLAFVVLGFYGLSGEHLQQLSLSHWESPLSLVAAGMVIFVAYEGFELIANAAPDIVDPSKNIARAYLISVIFVILLYVAIAIITVGSLPFEQIAKAEDYVLAEAAKPMLGSMGFSVITIAAMISTFSAINASLYGGSRVSYELAEDDEAPHELTYLLWNQPVGLAITAALTLIIANTVNLESISTSGSIGFLVIFLAVNITAFKTSKETQANKAITLAAALLCLCALLTLVGQQLDANPMGAVMALALVALSFLFEWVFKKYFD